MSSDERMPLVQPACKQKLPVTREQTLWWCKALIPPLCLYAAGTVFLMLDQQWSLLTSAYVITQIITTIGYGDFTPTSNASKIFLSFYAIVALVFAAYAIGMLCDSVIKMESDSIRKHLINMEAQEGAITRRHSTVLGEARDRFGRMNQLIAAVAPSAVFLLAGTVMFRFLEHCTCGMEPAAGCKDLDFATCQSTGGHVKHAFDAFYMSVMTLTTIGFGDMYPRTYLGRCLAIPWMLLGVAIFGHGITTLSSLIYESQKSSRMMAADAVSSISKDVFDKIDRDGNGYLDRSEFIAYTLLKYDVVSEELLEAVFKEYESLEGSKDRQVSYATIAERQHRRQSAGQKIAGDGLEAVAP